MKETRHRSERQRPVHVCCSRAIVVACAVVFLDCGRFADACSIPVFRYALERWQSDLFEVDVFYRGELSEAERSAVTAFEDRSLVNGGQVNLEVILCDVESRLDSDLQAVWEGLAEPALPYVVVRAPRGRTGSPIVWQGLLNSLPTLWGDAPVEREILRRLLAGDAIVWVVLAGDDPTAAERLVNTMEETFPTITQNIALPEGIGLPGSQLLSAIPLEIRFSVLTVTPEQSANSWLRRTVAAMSRELLAEGESVVVPVFGRGRALAAVKAADVDADSLEELARFLCGACSCQVKELNPGFDLLLAIHWDEQLFDPNATPIPDAIPDPREGPPAEPELVPIPTGTVTADAEVSIAVVPFAPKPAFETPEPSKSAPLNGLHWLLPAAGVVVVAYLWRRNRSTG